VTGNRGDWPRTGCRGAVTYQAQGRALRQVPDLPGPLPVCEAAQEKPGHRNRSVPRLNSSLRGSRSGASLRIFQSMALPTGSASVTPAL